MALLQNPLIHCDPFGEPSEPSIQQWPAHLAKDVADVIHRDVVDTLSQSRLAPRTDGIKLVQRHDIARVERVLGSGAFSQVSSVIARDGRRYACKHLQQRLMDQPNDFRTAAVELVYEAHMLSSFDHPNILKIRGWAHNGVASFAEGWNNSFFLLLDVLDETLDMRIERWHREQQDGMWSMVTSPSSATQQMETRYLEKLRIMNELASALDYIHQRGVIFRDAKPQNIGFLGDRVQLFDFGLSRELPLLDTSVQFEMSGKVGTLRYMAPEVATNQPYGISADVYSWAMVSYEILSLVKPFDGWTREMHANFVCLQGQRPDMVHCTEPIPMEVQVLLEHSWNAIASVRPHLSQIMNQLDYLTGCQVQKVQDQQIQLDIARQLESEIQLQQALFQIDLESCIVQAATTKRVRKNSFDSIETIDTRSLSTDSEGFF
eukprot:CAMPEP_0113618276 /NCGR_PEP_ID=MMETSP0017_2-20120614/9246_1 /TAXON_ID=2856 /ORGANISM="Cylindrotheca closterium" /LENGTH=432 /DNA_ID=CAMNT_0000527765 /DNA_START=28 /DNA_END=1326 /DNA_ORIENTATION=- /assembly_acc=CAM_ASM_000147